jgi:hypothetical protein
VRKDIEDNIFVAQRKRRRSASVSSRGDVCGGLRALAGKGVKARVAPRAVTLTQGSSDYAKKLSNQKEQMAYLFDLP